MTTCPYSFRIVGPLWDARRLVDADAALRGYADCDSRSDVLRESHLSVFRFGQDFGRHLRETGSTAGFTGPCWSAWTWFDLDAGELADAHTNAGALAVFLVDRYGVADDEMLYFFSGRRGFHLALPTALWSPPPSVDFHRVARRFAEQVAERARVKIDNAIYGRVHPLRAPNSRHPETGLHKRRLSLDELLGPLDTIVALAKSPARFALPTSPGKSEQAAADWQTAADHLAREGEAKAAQRAAGNGAATLNRETLAFIRDGAPVGDRHKRLFRASANLAEFNCPPALAIALLEESALDIGLQPKDVLRQIKCGLAAPTRQASAGSTPDAVACDDVGRDEHSGQLEPIRKDFSGFLGFRRRCGS